MGLAWWYQDSSGFTMIFQVLEQSVWITDLIPNNLFKDKESVDSHSQSWQVYTLESRYIKPHNYIIYTETFNIHAHLKVGSAGGRQEIRITVSIVPGWEAGLGRNSEMIKWDQGLHLAASFCFLGILKTPQISEVVFSLWPTTILFVS